MAQENGLATASDSSKTRRETAAATVLHLARGAAMQSAVRRLNAGRLVEAEGIVRRHLTTNPHDVAALCMLGDLAARGGVHAEAERLFRLALAEQPAFTEAQLNLAKILALRDGVGEAIAILDDILADYPDHLHVALMRLSLLGQIGDYARASRESEALVIAHPDAPNVRVAHAHLCNTLGDMEASIRSYRQAIARDPANGDAWWGLANLKIYRFDDAQIARA